MCSRSATWSAAGSSASWPNSGVRSADPGGWVYR
jgi:hypothetical protein